MSVRATLPWEQRPSKIQARHRDRLAVVYVRQSTRQQILDHGESTRLQYGLAERAVTLGWPSSRVLVIDEDLGRSGTNAVGRPGFQRLVTEVTMEHVGVVLGVEMSRLAHSGRDWQQLLELCALSSTLLADPDGVYDPAEYNDRLLLGLKGTMSEAELYLIRQRMLSGKLAKAQRGELAIALPIGYVRKPSGEAAFDPDEQAQAVVRLVFSRFDELGTLHGVLRAGRAWRPTTGAHPLGARQGRAGMAASQPGDVAEHAAQPCLRGDLRLRAAACGCAVAGGGTAGHRAGGARPRRLVGDAARPAAGLHQPTCQTLRS
jgi:DNA invertase Pin-like site-specific DNA recombinase